ncbi:MAG: hypothetical protein HY655_11255 [Acidobacteria bacterium]|nr:hypothetical protein [Acidobacteriota bacterium]
MNKDAPRRQCPLRAQISVVHESGARYVVTVEEGGGSTTHEVIVWPSDVERYAPGASPEALVRASFEFLLAREPKEAILRRFELPVIERYFPEYPRVIETMVG